RELGTKVEPEQKVCVDGQPLQPERTVYWLVNKPRGYLCTNFDPAGRPEHAKAVLQEFQQLAKQNGVG
ncbi:MAG TPA: hypothetical protein VGY66_26315, partial [Gemmataceae bacterium]|nr:hypothetical protein [Gemmataceae bacterium]